MATCRERADILALVFFVMSSYCVFVTFPCGMLGQVWYMIVSIPGLEVIKLEYSLKLKIKRKDWLLIVLYFELENELKF